MNRKQCRCCRKHYTRRKELISLFDYDQTFPENSILFADMLKLVSGEDEISSTDLLPKKVCALCLSNIRTCYYFQLEVKRSLEILRSEIPNIKQEASETHIAIILSPRHVQEEFSDDMLDEIHTYNEEDQEIIDYEPLELEDEQNETFYQSNQSQTNADETVMDTSKSKEGVKNFDCDICNKSFINSKALVSHYRFHQASKCAHCEKKFLNSTQLKLHVRAKHPEQYNSFRIGYQEITISLTRMEKEDFYECSQCLQKFSHKLSLYKHHASCDNKCPECGLRIPHSDLFFKHLETAHSIKLCSANDSAKEIECPFCFLSFNESTLQYHIQQCHPDGETSIVDSISETGESTSNDSFMYQCELCAAKFQSLKGLNQHKTLKHSSVKSKNESGGEVKSIKNIPKYTRDEFVEKFLVRKSKDFYRCIPCKKEIGIRSTMLHMRSKHAAIRSFRCELCPEAFFRADYRQRHFSSNHPNSFRCYSCNIQFDRMHKIDFHNHSYHNVPLKCSKPEEGQDLYDLSPNAIKYIENTKNFDYSDDLALLQSNAQTNIIIPHISNNCVTPTYENPLSKDEFCERNMSHVSDKIVHCNDCQQDIQKSSLISHLLWKHSVDKPLKCPFCNHRVVKNNARLLHMAKCHPNQYKCSDCQMQFVKHQNLSDHCEEVHRKKCNVQKSSGEVEDLQLGDMRFVVNRNEDDAIENEIMNETEIINIDTVQVERKFSCPHCSKSFTSSKNLLIHKSHKHKNELNLSDSQNTCDNDDSMSYEEFRCNWTEDIDDISVKCIVCELKLKKTNFANHLKARHCTVGAFLCEICDEQFFKPEDRLQHFSSYHRGIFFCDTCNIQHICNSKYARHMEETHGIEMDHSSRKEVDLNVCDLRFVASIRKSTSDEQRTPMNINGNQEDDNTDPMEEMMQQMSNTEEMTRADFMIMYFQNINRETKYCIACNKTFQSSSLYHHLIHFHATILPYKCPFCEVRLERSSTRARHLQVFHPNEYKCNMCGIQFQKHSKYSDHMTIEHNQTVVSEKSPLEEEDISSAEIRYVANREESTTWHDEESNLLSSSTMVSYFNQDFEDSKTSKETTFAFPTIKKEEESKSLLQELHLPQFSETTETYYSYQDFKDTFLKSVDSLTFECIPCKRVVIRTSVCAHLRLWHASKMMFNCELCPIGFRRHDYRQRHMASTHPQDFLCKKCNQQFYRSAVYVDHMKTAHKISLNLPELKSKDEVDVPLENMSFMANVPDSERTHPEESIRTKRRLSVVLDDRPIYPEAGGLTYRDFCLEHIRGDGDLMTCVPCNQQISKLSLKKHLKKYHATSRPYNCELCEQSFFLVYERMSHMRTMHPNSLKCAICETQFYMSANYVEHMKTVHGQTVKPLSNKGKTDIDVPIERLRFVINKDRGNVKQVQRKKPVIADQFSCIPDDAEMTREQFSKKFLRAVKPKIGEPQTRCIACLKIFSSKNRYFHVLHNHVIKRPFGCEFCEMRFFTSFKRTKHMAYKHTNEIKCSSCNIQFERTLTYSSHMKESHQTELFVSNHDETLDIPNNQLRFTKKSTSVRVLSREQQKETFENETSIDFSSISGLVQDLKCQSCDLEFDSSRSYRQHMRDHGSSLEFIVKTEDVPKIKLEEKPRDFHACDLCEKKLLTKYALNAHKKFKHGINLDGTAVNSRKKFEKQFKFNVECEICNFSSFRRDYVEHHVKQAHKGELNCDLCTRQLSNYNYFIQHLSNHSSDTKKEYNIRLATFKCDFCEKSFRYEENKEKHQNSKHGDNVPTRLFFCIYCNVNYHSKQNFDIHLEGYKHKKLQTFLLANSNAKESTTSSTQGPAAKRPRLELNSTLSDDCEDKLEYLKFLDQLPNGSYKCGICGKIKVSRKFLLHHLKQHEEVPTFNCSKCPERFVFKRKYDKHIRIHEKNDSSNLVNTDDDVINNEIVDKHPKFQETTKVTQCEGIRCNVCKMSFKLTIMLNKHNATWHSEENPNKDLSMQEQKHKNKEVGTIKLHRCNFCSDTYHRPEKLEEHLRCAHADVKSTETLKFKCSKCKLTFDEQQFLENHEKLFCLFRSNTPVGKEVKAEFMNEQ